VKRETVELLTRVNVVDPSVVGVATIDLGGSGSEIGEVVFAENDFDSFIDSDVLERKRRKRLVEKFEKKRSYREFGVLTCPRLMSLNPAWISSLVSASPYKWIMNSLKPS